MTNEIPGRSLVDWYISLRNIWSTRLRWFRKNMQGNLDFQRAFAMVFCYIRQRQHVTPHNTEKYEHIKTFH